MWLKKLTPMRLTRFPDLSADDLEAALAKHAFVPCGALQPQSLGFVPAFDRDRYAGPLDGAFWVQVRIERKPVPGAAVKAELKARMEAVEAKDGRKVGRKEKKELKERIVDELLAQAIPVQSTTTVLLDAKAGHVLFDATGTKKVEQLVDLLRKALPGLELAFMDFVRPVDVAMAGLLLGEAPTIFTADSGLALKHPSTGAKARFSACNLGEPEIVAHLRAGMKVESLEMTFNDRVSFALTSAFTLGKLKFLEVVKDDLEDAGANGEDEALAATLLLQVGETRELMASLGDWVRIRHLVGAEAAEADGVPA